MITLEEWSKGKHEQFIKAAHVGMPGEGKTHLAATYPANIFCITTPGEEETFLNNKELRKNIVGWEYFHPTDEISATQCINNLRTFLRKDVRDGIKAGTVKTVTIDNLTHLAQTFWKQLCKDDKSLFMTKSREFDTRGAYGELKDRLYDFCTEELIPLKCNIIINVHLKLEDEKTMEMKPDKSIMYSPLIPGSFRDLLPGIVSYIFYLEKKKVGDKYVYTVRTNKSNGMAAKSRLPLPSVIENVTYTKLKTVIDQLRGN